MEVRGLQYSVSLLFGYRYLIYMLKLIMNGVNIAISRHNKKTSAKVGGGLRIYFCKYPFQKERLHVNDRENR